MSSTKQLFLNTRTRTEGSNANASWNLTNMLDIGGKRMSIQSVQFPNQMYPFNLSRENYIVYFQEDSDTGITYEANITLGTDYNGTSIAVELASILTAASGNAFTYTVTYDVIAKKLTVNSTGSFRFVDGPFTANAELGYDAEVDFTFLTSRTLTNPVDLSGTKFVDVVSPYAGNSSFNSGGRFSTLARIPTIASFGEVVLYSSSNKTQIPVPYGATTIQFELRDDRSKLIELGSNGYVGYSLLLE